MATGHLEELIDDLKDCRLDQNKIYNMVKVIKNIRTQLEKDSTNLSSLSSDQELQALYAQLEALDHIDPHWDNMADNVATVSAFVTLSFFVIALLTEGAGTSPIWIPAILIAGFGSYTLSAGSFIMINSPASFASWYYQNYEDPNFDEHIKLMSSTFLKRVLINSYSQNQ